MEEDEAMLIAARYFDAWNHHDPEAVRDAFVPHGKRVDHALGEARDPEGVRRLAEAWIAAFPDFRVELRNIIVFEEEMAAEWVFQGTHEGELAAGPLRLPPTGRALDLQGCSVYRFEDGRIRHEHLYANTLTLLAQLGLRDASGLESLLEGAAGEAPRA